MQVKKYRFVLVIISLQIHDTWRYLLAKKTIFVHLLIKLMRIFCNMLCVKDSYVRKKISHTAHLMAIAKFYYSV